MHNTQHAICRKMTEADLEMVLRWRNHPDIRRYMYTAHEITPEEHSAWFRKASVDPSKHLLMYESNGEPLGVVNLTEIKAGGIAEWGFYMSPEAERGSGRKMGNTALSHAFNSLQLHKVCGQSLANNEKSIRFHEKLGFQQEGALRQHHFDGVSYIDVICFGLLATEYQARLENCANE